MIIIYQYLSLTSEKRLASISIMLEVYNCFTSPSWISSFATLNAHTHGSVHVECCSKTSWFVFQAFCSCAVFLCVRAWPRTLDWAPGYVLRTLYITHITYITVTGCLISANNAECSQESPHTNQELNCLSGVMFITTGTSTVVVCRCLLILRLLFSISLVYIDKILINAFIINIYILGTK